MVYASKTFEDDLVDLVFALANWEKHPLTWEHAEHYVNDIINQAYSLDCKITHRPCSHFIHKIYGEFVHPYKRNQHTTWYIIYDKTRDCIYLQKLINNYLSV